MVSEDKYVEQLIKRIQIEDSFLDTITDEHIFNNDEIAEQVFSIAFNRDDDLAELESMSKITYAYYKKTRFEKAKSFSKNAPAQPQAWQQVADRKHGRPKKNNEIKIKGFNGRVFTNHAKQAAFEVWLDLRRGEHHVTAKELFNELYRMASDYNLVLTEWSVIDDTTLHFKTNSLRFSSLNTGGFIRDFEEAKSFLSTNNNKN